MTSFDQLWTTFLTNCKMSPQDLPQTETLIYETIQSAVLHFNNRLRLNIKCDNTQELLSEELSEDYLLILAHTIKLIILQNQLTYSVTKFEPFQKDIGRKNYKEQIGAQERQVANQEELISRLIINTEEDYL